jgi:hypothetical protein
MTPYPGMAPPTAPESGPEEVKTYCIEEYPDGTFKFGVEMPEGAEPPLGAEEAPPDDDGYQQAATFEEALKGLQALRAGDSDEQKGFDSVAATEPNGPFQRNPM